MEKSLKNKRTFDLKWFGWKSGGNTGPVIKSHLREKFNNKTVVK